MISEKLIALYRLTLIGVGGEQENALNKLEILLQKENISIDAVIFEYNKIYNIPNPIKTVTRTSYSDIRQDSQPVKKETFYEARERFEKEKYGHDILQDKEIHLEYYKKRLEKFGISVGEEIEYHHGFRYKAVVINPFGEYEYMNDKRYDINMKMKHWEKSNVIYIEGMEFGFLKRKTILAYQLTKLDKKVKRKR